MIKINATTNDAEAAIPNPNEVRCPLKPDVSKIYETKDTKHFNCGKNNFSSNFGIYFLSTWCFG